MFARFRKPKRRPSYPSPTRQWQGLIAILATMALVELLRTNVPQVRNPDGFLVLAVMIVTHFSGLRMGVICTGVTIAYVAFAFSNPTILFDYSPEKAKRLVSIVIGLPFYVLLIGGIGGKLRTARIREFEAKDRAEEEGRQRRSIEATLQSSEEMRRFVIDSAMDAIIAIRDDGRITLWNPSATRKFGWTSEEAVGQLLSDLIIPPGQRGAHIEGMRRFLETGETSVIGKRLELAALTKDGREFPIELSVAQHLAADGHIFIGFIRDMTEQKKLNERLRQAQKMEAIGTLAGGIAHDFNNVLTAISGNVLLAQQDVPSDNPAQESLGEIEKSIHRATDIVRQILTFSRTTETSAQALPLASVMDDAIHLLKATIPATMEIDYHVGQGLPVVLADATDIHQIVLNLGINSFHALKGQTGKFEVQVNQISLDEETAKNLTGLSPGNYIRLSFTDTGCGMDEATLQRVFEPFFTTKAVGEGTGLGLAVVYGIVSRHGGAIVPYSEPNKGTVFHIYLPAAESVAVHTQAEQAAPKIGNGEKILYVDDDESLVFMMKRMLGRLNYEVQGFSDPAEGLAAFRDDPAGFDLVITDMSMPQLSGPALVGELQAIRPEVPIVMVTGYIRPDDLEQAQHLGIRDLIVKPNTVHEMSEVLHRIIAGEPDA